MAQQQTKTLKEEILELKKIASSTKDEKNKYITDLNLEGFATDPVIRFEILKNSAEFKNSLPKLDILSMKLQFISPEVVRKLAVVECEVIDLNSIKGINSIKMGSFVKKDVLCQTCSLNRSECTGHIGYIELAAPFIHPLAIDYTKLVLECVCEYCGYVNLPSEVKKRYIKQTNKDTYKKLKEISKLVKNGSVCYNVNNGTKKCRNNIPKNKITYEPSKTIDGSKIVKNIKIGGNSEDIVMFIGVKEIKELFKKISNYDLKVFGFENGSTPVNFILEALPVIPERDRPTIRLKTKESLDDLTVVYLSVLKTNISLKKELILSGATKDEQKINAYKKQLWNEIRNLMNNNKGLKKIGSTAVAKTLNTKLSGKNGYCRRGAQAKRVDYAGRTVINGAVCEFGWVFLPDKFKNMTIKEYVFDMNIDRIKRAARAGQIFKIMKRGTTNEFYYDKITQFQLARRRADPTKTFVDGEDDETVDNIEIGDLVYRNLEAGDDVYINRQPTNHRHSIIGCRTNFFKNKNTVQIHMSYTKPLNADFDGDAMNVHVPQTITARAEIRHLLNATKQIMSVKNSSPIMTLLFNCPTAAYLLSKDFDSYEIFTSPAEERAFCDYIFPEDEGFFDFNDYVNRLEKYKVKRRTPQALFSMLFPADFNYKKSIRNGIYLGDGGEKFLEKEDVSNHLIHSLYSKYGSVVAAYFITKGQFVLDFFIERRGFTIGLKDMVLKTDKSKFEKVISEVRSRVFELEKRAAYTDLEKKHKQQQILDALMTPIDNEFGKAITEYEQEKDNNLVTMVKSKAAGEFKNITKIMVTHGQHVIHGSRPAKTIYGNRYISYFDVGDNSIESRGFSVNGFVDGLDPAASFTQAQESRIGLLKMALDTAEIGALTKRISKVVEGEVLNYDGGVIDAKGNYTQLCYDDGYNKEEVIRVEFDSTGKLFLPFDIRAILMDMDGLI